LPVIAWDPFPSFRPEIRSRICAGMTPACRLAAAVQIGTFGIAWQRCPAHETGGAPPISAANQDLSAEHPRDLVALVHVHRASPRRRAPGHRRSSAGLNP
jgi:hypothetical protein